MKKGSAPRGDSYRRIWKTVRMIPRGRVATYGEVARLSGLPRQPRLAGYALHNLPPGSDIPWHRVVNARGMISLPRVNGAYLRQRGKLEAEGITFINERVDFARYGWHRMRVSLRRRR